MKLCEDCPLIDKTGGYCLAPGTQPCCSVCGCKLAFKTRSRASECPHPDGPRWLATMTQDAEDELYSSINYNPDK